MKIRRCVFAFLAALLAVGGTAQAGSQADAKHSQRLAQRETPVVRAYRLARPAVINVASESVVTRRGRFFGNDPLEDIFPSPFRRQVEVESLGTGVIVNPAGYAVTNAHVVRQARKITVTTVDGNEYDAKVLSADPQCDLAILKIDISKLGKGASLPYLPLGRSDDLMVGETVIAIGNPMGFSNTLTTGVISAVGRDLEFRGGVRIKDLIQTDAPINPGNSGGPLLNILGEWIGVNTAISADAQNIGFAIPADTLADQLAGLLDFERLNRVTFGASVRQRHGEDGDEVVVAKIAPDAPAAKGLREGDRILKLNGLTVRQMPDYCFGMLASPPNEPVRFRVRRAGRELDVSVTMLVKPRPDGVKLAEGLFGMALREVTPELAKDQGLSIDRGLMVVGLDADGPAGPAGHQAPGRADPGGSAVRDRSGLLGRGAGRCRSGLEGSRGNRPRPCAGVGDDTNRGATPNPSPLREKSARRAG